MSTSAAPVTPDTLQLLIANIRDYAIILLDRDGLIRTWNVGAERIKGYREAEVVGRPFTIFYTTEDLAAGKAALELRVAAEEGRFEDEGWRVRKDGSKFWANVVLTAIRSPTGELLGYGKLTRDVTDRKRVEDDLRYSEERLRLMIDSVKDYAIYTLDPTGIVASWNAGAQRLKQYDPDEIIGTHFAAFYPPEERDSGKPQLELEVARRDGRFEEESWRVRKDGSRFWANVVLSVQKDHNGVIRGFTKVTRDMTERKKADEEQRALGERVLRSNRELEHFASIASHDLQEPLRKIQAFGDQLHLEFGGKLEGDGAFYLERMRAAATRMRRLIDDLLAFSRVSNQDHKVGVVDLQEVVTNALGDLEQRVAETGAQIEVGTLGRIEGDAFQIQQLCMNLIGNALKFHQPEKPPHIKISATPVHQGLTAALELRFADDGIGIERKYQARIFELFQRLHAKETYEGTGLGLSICRRIADRHGGSIHVDSTPGKGSTFVVTLPVKQVVLQANDEPRASP